MDPSVVLDGSTGQTACNSYYFYQKDVDALQSLGVWTDKIFFILYTVVTPTHDYGHLECQQIKKEKSISFFLFLS